MFKKYVESNRQMSELESPNDLACVSKRFNDNSSNSNSNNTV